MVTLKKIVFIWDYETIFYWDSFLTKDKIFYFSDILKIDCSAM